MLRPEGAFITKAAFIMKQAPWLLMALGGMLGAGLPAAAQERTDAELAPPPRAADVRPEQPAKRRGLFRPFLSRLLGGEVPQPYESRRTVTPVAGVQEFENGPSLGPPQYGTEITLGTPTADPEGQHPLAAPSVTQAGATVSGARQTVTEGGPYRVPPVTPAGATVQGPSFGTPPATLPPEAGLLPFDGGAARPGPAVPLPAPMAVGCQPGEFVQSPVPLYPRVRVKDAKHIPPGAVPATVAIRDPLNPAGVVFVQAFLPPWGCRRVKVEDGGAEVKLDCGSYKIEIESHRRGITVEYDD